MKWITMILMTCGMAHAGVSSNFYADFDVPDSGGAGSLSQASPLDAGTRIGSWSIGSAYETDANEVGSVEFFGDGSAYCGAWYDRISLASEDLYMNPFTSEWSIADPCLIK
ncbi:MAG: hypothetical protein JXR25_05595 [Pontiellaceae bacterium]|nr:hypothetical protein [Pontiellaceae bacterium]MBN2784280.1 hypothetical protein [Pontiellaceae bacterium]